MKAGPQNNRNGGEAWHRDFIVKGYFTEKHQKNNGVDQHKNNAQDKFLFKVGGGSIIAHKVVGNTEKDP
jgi:hypothetical protein